jgi:copper chaperone CopZ
MSNTPSDSDNQSHYTNTEVTRRLHAPSLRGGDGEKRLREELGKLEGVHEVRLQPEKKRVIVQYDATKQDVQRVAATLAGLGYPVANSFWSRLKQTWYGFLDENIRDNAAAPPKPCCHDTSRLQAGRRKH